MKNLFTLLFLGAFFSSTALAQDTADFYNKEEAARSAPKPPYSIREHIFTGGNFGLQFGTITLVDVSPLIGYKITPKIAAAIGVTYTYYKDSRPPAFTQSIYGARLIGRYFIFDNLFVHAEAEGLNSKWEYYQPPFTIYNILGGAGYRQAISDRLFFDAMLLWNFTPSDYTPYNNPIIRIGFNIGL
ncbi:MAG TPA: hypothetical protein PLI68_04690 [Bacteroidia bacterium]|nr:hypothetical protein [Bacteroidia bacterium]